MYYTLTNNPERLRMVENIRTEMVEKMDTRKVLTRTSHTSSKVSLEAGGFTSKNSSFYMC